jgi:hypothetical protein
MPQKPENRQPRKRKNCTDLKTRAADAKRKRWADEDVSRSAGKSRERAIVKERRVAEQFDVECKKFGVTG